MDGKTEPMANQGSKDGVRKTFYSSKPGRAGQRDANKKADEWLDYGVSSSIKVADAWQKFLIYRKDVSEIEYGKIEYFGRLYFLPSVGGKKVETLTEQDLQEILDHAFKHPAGTKSKQLSRKSLSNFASYEKQFIKFCRRSKWTSLFPEDLRVPAAARNCEKRILQLGDLIKVMNIDTTTYRGKRIPDQFINYYRFQIFTGLRPGELQGLRWSDIQGNICTVRRSINVHGEETRGKNENALRSFVLIPMALEVLNSQKIRLAILI